MLKIRKEQMDELAKVSLGNFENGMVGHVKRFFPKYHDVMGEPAVRKTIRYGVDRAEAYGFTAERDVCQYINLMFLLGSDFDADIQLPWLAAIFGDASIKEPGERMDRAYDAAMIYLDDVAGAENEYAGQALRSVREFPFEEIPPSATGTAEDRIDRALGRIWPRKYARLGGASVRGLVRDGMRRAQGHGVTGDRGVAIFVVFMFLAGSGFDRDPQFPWAEAILTDRSLPDPSAKVYLLHKGMMSFIDKWLAQ
jgi:hypothetical protein